ncbi:inactive protein kinase SELMODRAFT_444075-like [Tasmannia lanceolata]|uniref:inactive protein kinase SELMODRAFT_444075-like n=1 Tax=Tasmannia lanceolata TaxID=3420 RepID=UPI004064205C
MGGLRRGAKQGEVVVVAVDASKEITDYALEWAVRNVVKAEDTLVLLALLPSSVPKDRHNDSRFHHFVTCLFKKWGLHHDKDDSSRESSGDRGDKEVHKINTVCIHMMKQLCSANHVTEVVTSVKTITDAQMGSVATKAQELGAVWVILDRRLKKEGDCCLKQLSCSVILIDHAIPKILRLVNSQSRDEEDSSIGGLQDNPTAADDNMAGMYLPNSNVTTPPSSLGLDSHSPNTDLSCSFSSIDRDDTNQIMKNFRPLKSFMPPNSDLLRHESKVQGAPRSVPFSTKSQELRKVSKFDYDDPKVETTRKHTDTNKNFSGKLMEKPPKVPVLARRSVDSLRSKPPSSRRGSIKGDGQRERNNAVVLSSSSEQITEPIDRTSSIRRAISLSIKQPPNPPPLCSVCKHSAPIFGKPPRKFSYEEIEMATDGFSTENFLAEGGYGPVYKGVLPDGQVVAVKQHKTVSAQGASEFCSEVEVLSCAQHRNLVMLVGYSMEKEWLLVYEFACNGSLDKHLYGEHAKEVMAWENRMKVAIGAARGLRYLHEDCRVGCIVHRDLRPNNILLTHDFESMVGDFGLARWQTDGQSAEETRIIGTFGYLAPEYTQTGQITEKADVYAFGVLLMELLSGLKAIDLSRGQGRQYLPEWGRPLLEKKMIHEFIDPRLDGQYVVHEAECMMYAANLCISTDPRRRPRMSKVLRVLEGDMVSVMSSQVSLKSARTWAHTEFGELVVEKSRMSNHNVTKMKQRYGFDDESEGPHDKNYLSNQSENLVSKEYQAYLQGSLAEFIHNMKTKYSENGDSISLSDDSGYQTNSPVSRRSFRPM